MKYKLTIWPALEAAAQEIEFLFETAEQMVVAKDTCADLLLFMQDKMKIMPDYSNTFEMEEFIDEEWEEYEEF
jgi:hypothetical protein